LIIQFLSLLYLSVSTYHISYHIPFSATLNCNRKMYIDLLCICLFIICRLLYV
jgi:hypothetical protein